MICPRCRQVFLPQSLVSTASSEVKRKGNATMAMSITTSCPYCRFGPIHSFEFLKACPNCGTISSKEARFCPGCGTPTNEWGNKQPAQIETQETHGVR